jgi:tripartite motif-containing protein 71
MRQLRRAVQGRARWLVFFTFLLLAASAMPVLADPPAGEQSPVSESEAGGEVDPSLLPDAADLAKGEEQLKKEEAERARELEAPPAVAEREESALAYRGLESAAAVSDLLRSSFADQLATIDQDPARVLSDGTLKRNLGNDGGAVISDEGKPELIEAEIPAQVRDEDGEMSKVDLSLEAISDGFEPANPITDLTIPVSPAEGISIGVSGETSIIQAGADPESSAYRFGDKDVIYPEVQTDTDLLVSPLSTGVEFSDQLRSIESPETLRFDLGLPEGAELRANAGVAEVWEGEKVTAIVSPPHAVDAQGTRVPVSMDVQGSSLILSVAHREGDYAYPILVDPEYTQNDWVNNAWIFGFRYDVLEDWTFQHNSNIDFYNERWCRPGGPCWGTGRGLFVGVPSGSWGGGLWSQWTYTALGETSYLTGYLISPFYRFDQYNSACWSDKHPEPHDYDGLWSPTYGVWYQLYTNRALQAPNASIYGNAAPPAKMMVFGLSTGGGANDPCWRDLYAGGIATYMTDPDYPTIDPISVPPGEWIDDSKLYGLKVSAHDKGLGVSNITLNVEGSPQAKLKEPCAGNHDSPCPPNASGTIPYNADNFDEGVSLVTPVASDALARPASAQSFWVYVDSTPPKLTLSGQLATATKEAEGNANDPEEWDDLSLPTYNLTIKAEDGSGASNKTRRSGAKNIEVFVDGVKQEVPWSPKPTPCENCEMTQTFQLKLAGLAAGKHTLKVFAVDQLGHKSERDIEFEYIPATGMKDEYVTQHFPLPDGQGNEAEEENPTRPELAVNVMNGNLVYREKDVDVPGYAADLEVERFYNSQLPDSANTEWGDGWTLAQTPELEPEVGVMPKEAELIDASGALEDEVQLPTEVGKTKFDPTLQATLTKEAGGGYELADDSGETSSAIVFDASGRTDELRTEGYAKVDYDYEAGKLDEIAIKDPGSASDLSEAEEEALEYDPPAPSFKSAFGTWGTSDGQLQMPSDIALAANGDLFVLDRASNRVQRFGQGGNYISKFGSYGTGNGQFKEPSSIAIDAAGNLYVADSLNNRIEKFNEKGEFIKAFGASGASDGQFAKPEGIAVDAKGNVLVADTGNRRIQKFNASGEFLAKFGSYGTGDGQFYKPNSIDVGPGGIWVTDLSLNRVTKFNEAGEFVMKFGSQGTADGQFKSPTAIEVDSRGNVWVAQEESARVQQFSQSGKFLAKFGSGGSGEGQFKGWGGRSIGIAVDNKGGLWVADLYNARVQKWGVPNYRPSWYGAFGTVGTGDGQMKVPADTAIAPNGDVFVLDKGNARVLRFSSTGKYLSKFGSAGTGNGQLKAPTSIAIDGSNNLWVTDAGNYRVQEFTEGGEFIRAVGSSGTGNAQFSIAEGIATDLKGNVYVADTYNRRIQVFDEEGNYLSKFGTAGSGLGQFTEANAVDVGRHGNVYVADWGANKIQVFNEKGESLLQFGSTGAGEGQFNHADAIEADEKGNVWVGDQSNGRIELFNEAGEYLTQFGAKGSGEGQFSFAYPMGITADPSGGLWITDVSNNRIQKWQVPSTEPPKPLEENDPSVDVSLSSGLISSVEGEEAGVNTYAHTGELLTANEGPDGETKYEYDAEGRLKKVALPNGTWGSITYNTTSRVSKVTVFDATSETTKSTNFAYNDEPRRTTVTPEYGEIVTYDIGEDGSVVKSQNTNKPPTIENISGTLYANRGKEVKSGVQNLKVKASSPEGIASIQIVANGTSLVDEATCTEDQETTKVECEYPPEDEWVMETEDFAPGVLNLEVIVTARNKQAATAAERFWVNIPQPPPPPPAGLPVTPKFKDILHFREEFGLDIWEPVNDETEVNDRVYDLINAWTAGESVARASWERWGVPLRTQDVAELEYREWYYDVNAERISQWVNESQPSSFAGYYMDQAAGGIMHIGFLDKQAEQLASLKASLSLIGGERLQVYPTTPTASYLSVRAASQSVSNAIDSNSILRELVVDVEEDEAGKVVRIGTPNVTQVQGILNQTLGSNAPIAVEYDAGGGGLLSGRFRNEGRMRAGDAIFTRHYTAEGVHDGNRPCTAGFGAKDKAGEVGGQVVWRLFVLTAGHCSDPGEKLVFRSTDSDSLNENHWKEVGAVARNALHQLDPVGTDAEAIRVQSDGIVPQGIFGWDGRLQPTNGARKAKIGNAVCFSGAMREVPQCGHIVARSTHWHSGVDGYARGGYWVKFSRPALPGDSGAPVWRPVCKDEPNASIGLVSAYRSNGTETLVEPLLHPPNMASNQVVGILDNQHMAPLSLKLGG